MKNIEMGTQTEPGRGVEVVSEEGERIRSAISSYLLNILMQKETIGVDAERDNTKDRPQETSDASEDLIPGKVISSNKVMIK